MTKNGHIKGQKKLISGNGSMESELEEEFLYSLVIIGTISNAKNLHG